MQISASLSSIDLSTTLLSRKSGLIPSQKLQLILSLSDYASRVFGFETFGVVYGSIICLSGLFNFAQSGLDALTHGRFNNDPQPVNIFLLVSAFVVGVALVGYVWSKSRSIERAELEAEAEDADENVALMPGHDERVHEDHHPVDVHAEEGRGQ